jgi:hypothetical protein
MSYDHFLISVQSSKRAEQDAERGDREGVERGPEKEVQRARDGNLEPRLDDERERQAGRDQDERDRQAKVIEAALALLERLEQHGAARLEKKIGNPPTQLAIRATPESVEFLRQALGPGVEIEHNPLLGYG